MLPNNPAPERNKSIITFWLLGVLPALFFIFWFIYADDISRYYHFDLLTMHKFYLTLIIAPLIYFPIAIAIIWKYANRYVGDREWPTVVKLITVVPYLIYVVVMLSLALSTHTVLNSYIGDKNQAIDIATKTLRFQNKIIIDVTVLTPQKIEALKNAREKEIVHYLCAAPSTYKFLCVHGYKVIYEYYDVYEKPLYGFIVSDKNCNCHAERKIQ